MKRSEELVSEAISLLKQELQTKKEGAGEAPIARVGKNGNTSTAR